MSIQDVPCSMSLDVRSGSPLSILDSLIDDVGDRTESARKPDSQVMKQYNINRTSARSMMTVRARCPVRSRVTTSDMLSRTRQHTDTSGNRQLHRTLPFAHTRTCSWTDAMVHDTPSYPHVTHDSMPMNWLVCVNSNLFECLFFFPYAPHGTLFFGTFFFACPTEI